MNIPCKPKCVKPVVFDSQQLAKCDKCAWLSGLHLWCGGWGIYVRQPPQSQFETAESGLILPKNRPLIPSPVRGWQPAAGKQKGCGGCGQKAVDTVKKIVNIGKGYTALLAEKLFALPELSCPDADRRLAICRTDKCGKLTRLSKSTYLWFIVRHFRGVITNIVDLSVLPELPKKDDGLYEFCMMCKCYLPAKVRVEAEKCPFKSPKW